MNIYIASRTSERELVKKLNIFFVKNDYNVLDWTWHKNTKPYQKYKSLSKKYSLEDLSMVKKSDIFVLLTTEVPGSGSTTELGMALMAYSLYKKPKIYIVGNNINNMFYYHPDVVILKDVIELLKLLKLNYKKF